MILLHSILQTAPPPPPSVPSKKDTTYNSESFRFGGRCWWPGGAVVSRNILFTNSESRIIGGDFGSLVYYGVAKISLSWVWHRLWLSGSQRHIPIQRLLKSPLSPPPVKCGHSYISKWPLYFSSIDHTKVFLILSLTLLLCTNPLSAKPHQYLISPSDNNAKSRRKVQKLFLKNYYYYYQWNSLHKH